MRRHVALTAVLAGLTLGPAGGRAGAGHPHGPHHHHSAECPACIPGVYPDHRLDPGRGFVARKHPYRPSDHTMARAGVPLCLSPLAEPSYDHKYNGYYVGGGVAFNHGYPPRWPKEGTFGWDYDGYGLCSHLVNLGWSRGRLSQGGYGAYETETPFEVPNIFAKNPLEHFHKAEAEH